jgi:hypothetical protein
MLYEISDLSLWIPAPENLPDFNVCFTGIVSEEEEKSFFYYSE